MKFTKKQLTLISHILGMKDQKSRIPLTKELEDTYIKYWKEDHSELEGYLPENADDLLRESIRNRWHEYLPVEKLADLYGYRPHYGYEVMKIAQLNLLNAYIKAKRGSI